MNNYLHKLATTFAVFFSVAAFTACSNDGNDPTGTISTETRALSFTSSTYAKTFDVKAENAGEIRIDINYKSSESGWITAVKQEGGVLVTVTKNTTGVARSAEVVVNANNAHALTIPITQKSTVVSPLTGKWKPALDPSSFDDINYGQFYLTAEWKDPEKIPTLDMTAILGTELPVDVVFNIAQSLIQGFYYGGLKHFEFKEDGTLGAGYCELLDFMNLKFSEERTFPNAETLAVLPVDAITYFTKDDKVYFAIDKQYVRAMGKMLEGMDIEVLINGLLAKYPNLGILSTDEYYAIPLKYEIKEGILSILVDKEMIEPYKPLLTSLTMLIPETVSFQMDPTAEPISLPARALVTTLLDAIYEHTTSFEIRICLEKVV